MLVHIGGPALTETPATASVAAPRVPGMTRLDPASYVAHLRRDSARFRAVLADADPTAPVPACPDWDADDLLWHLADVQWFWSTVVTTRPAGPPEVHPERPATHDGLLAAFDEHSAALADALDAAGADEPAWTWADEQTVGFTMRRQAHEALVHRLDAEQVVGAITPLDPALAADGVEEALDVMYGGQPPTWCTFAPVAGTVRVVLTDTGHVLGAQPGTLDGTDPDSGRVLSGPHLLLVDDPGTGAAATITGAAGNVDAWLWKRRDDTGIERAGDQDVLAAFAAAVTPPID